MSLIFLQFLHFLFLFSYSLINRTLDKWFSRPFETVSQDARYVVAGLDQIARRSVAMEADRLAAELAAAEISPEGLAKLLQEKYPDLSRHGLDYIGVVNRQSQVVAEKGFVATPSIISLM